MYDLNFFEEYAEKRELKLDNKLVYYLLFGILISSLTGYISYNYFIIKDEQEIVSALKQEAEDSDIVSKVEEITGKEAQLSSLKESIDKIQLLDAQVEKAKKIDDLLLEDINDNIPNDIFLTSINIEEEQISIVGISKDKWAIPEFQKNLEFLDSYDDIFIPYITLEDGQYDFAIDITKRPVIEDIEGEIEEGEVEDEDEGTDQE